LSAQITFLDEPDLVFVNHGSHDGFNEDLKECKPNKTALGRYFEVGRAWAALCVTKSARVQGFGRTHWNDESDRSSRLVYQITLIIH